jgi:hypothetical protein
MAPEIPVTDRSGFWVGFVELEKWERMAVVSCNFDWRFYGKLSFGVEGGGVLMEDRRVRRRRIGKNGRLMAFVCLIRGQNPGELKSTTHADGSSSTCGLHESC